MTVHLSACERRNGDGEVNHENNDRCYRGCGWRSSDGGWSSVGTEYAWLYCHRPNGIRGVRRIRLRVEPRHQGRSERSCAERLSHRGGMDCVERTWFQNGCGALAVDQYGNGGAKGAMTREQAEARAVQTCEARGGSGCAVVGSQCASPGGEAGTWSGSEHVLAAPARDADEQRAEEKAEAAEARDESLTHDQRIKVQSALTALGFDAGPADGIFGPRTRSAIWDWQTAKGLDATGYLMGEQADALGVFGQADEAYQERTVPEGMEPDEQSSVVGELEASSTQNEVLHFPQCRDLVELAPDDLGCWEEISNRQDCTFFLPRFYSFTWTATNIQKTQIIWSGSCKNDVAQGRGKLEYNVLLSDRNGQDFELHFRETGEFVEGKMHGRWVMHWRGPAYHQQTNGADAEGPYVDGVRHGHWVERSRGIASAANKENTWEGSYANGLRHGRWVKRSLYRSCKSCELEVRKGAADCDHSGFGDIINTCDYVDTDD